MNSKSELENAKYELALSFGIGNDDKSRETLDMLCAKYPMHAEALLDFAIDFAIGLLSPDPNDPDDVALAHDMAKRIRDNIARGCR